MWSVLLAYKFGPPFAFQALAAGSEYVLEHAKSRVGSSTSLAALSTL